MHFRKITEENTQEYGQNADRKTIIEMRSDKILNVKILRRKKIGPRGIKRQEQRAL